MVKKMFRIVELEDCEIKQYVFLTDAESVESQLTDIYDALKDKPLQYKFGSSFTVTVLTTLCAGVAIALAIGLSNPTAKMIEDLSLQREIIVDGLENTNNEYLYTKFYIDAQELNVNKHRYENKKNSLWVGCFQDKRYEYVDYIGLKKENRND